jgi:hypothetical protein
MTKYLPVFLPAQIRPKKTPGKLAARRNSRVAASMELRQPLFWLLSS